jgi:hypothetical protein
MEPIRRNLFANITDQQQELSLLVETSQIDDQDNVSETSTNDILRDIQYTPRLFKPTQGIVCKEPTEEAKQQWKNIEEKKPENKRKPTTKNINSRYLKSTTSSNSRDRSHSNVSSVSLPATPVATLKENPYNSKPPRTPSGKKMRKKRKDINSGAWNSLTTALTLAVANDQSFQNPTMPPPPNRTPRACNHNSRSHAEENSSELGSVADESVADKRDFDDEDMDDASSITSNSSIATNVTMDSYKLDPSHKEWKLNKWRREHKQNVPTVVTQSPPPPPPLKKSKSDVGINTARREIKKEVIRPVNIVNNDRHFEAVVTSNAIVYDCMEAAVNQVEKVRGAVYDIFAQALGNERNRQGLISPPALALAPPPPPQVAKREIGTITEPYPTRNDPEQDKMCLCGKVDHVSESVMQQIAGGAEGDEPLPKSVLVDVRLYNQKESKIPVHTEKGVEAFFELYLKTPDQQPQRAALNVYYYVFVGAHSALPDRLFEGYDSNDRQAGETPTLKKSLWYEIAGHNMEGTDSIIVSRSPVTCDHVERMHMIISTNKKQGNNTSDEQEDAFIHKTFYSVFDKIFDIKRNSSPYDNEIHLKLASHIKQAMELLHSQTQVGEKAAIVLPEQPQETKVEIQPNVTVKNNSKTHCKCSIM